MSSQLSQDIEAIKHSSVPHEWHCMSWDAGSLQSWFGGLLARHNQLQGWLLQGRPKAFWLSGFFNPQVNLSLFFFE